MKHNISSYQYGSEPRKKPHRVWLFAVQISEYTTQIEIRTRITTKREGETHCDTLRLATNDWKKQEARD